MWEKNNQKYFSITFRLIEIEQMIFCTKLQITSSFFWPKNFGRSSKIAASKKQNPAPDLKIWNISEILVKASSKIFSTVKLLKNVWGWAQLSYEFEIQKVIGRVRVLFVPYPDNVLTCMLTDNSFFLQTQQDNFF